MTAKIEDDKQLNEHIEKLKRLNGELCAEVNELTAKVDKLKSLVLDMHAELVKDVTYVNPDGENALAPWAPEYLAPFEERMKRLGLGVDDG